jgi:hypothetical protein
MKMLRTGELTAAELSGLTRAWCEAYKAIREIDMKPLPKAIDVTKLGKRGRGKASAPVDPVEPVPTEPAKT